MEENLSVFDILDKRVDIRNEAKSVVLDHFIYDEICVTSLAEDVTIALGLDHEDEELMALVDEICFEVAEEVEL